MADLKITQTRNQTRNQKWKLKLQDSELSLIIKEWNEKHDYRTDKISRKGHVWRRGFSWRKFEHKGIQKFPKALDQGDKEMCIQYSLTSLFTFQLMLLATKHKCLVGAKPSLTYMKEVRATMVEKDIFYIPAFLDELQIRGLAEEKDFDKTPVLAGNHRFTVNYASIKPQLPDGIDSIKKAIEDVGGVLLLLVGFERDTRNRICFREVAETETSVMGKKQGREAVVLVRREGERKLVPARKQSGHAVFSYGWGTKKNRTFFLFLNSYGTKYKNGGHDEVRELGEINSVYTPQISIKTD